MEGRPDFLARDSEPGLARTIVRIVAAGSVKPCAVQSRRRTTLCASALPHPTPQCWHDRSLRLNTATPFA
ncbi:hypothetical protein APY04_1107 [Hyphomicrobium sulfonivorans]|uniref:Uncharacterized protein n=1 Tax=Hyphomicrobium sulfonivorans TaxID=121290 RepID=A0A109BK44_HYPSL|nr:hypothetical protein APY04_1107 [Hyphomicrobium sulfonivorans]